MEALPPCLTARFICFRIPSYRDKGVLVWYRTPFLCPEIQKKDCNSRSYRPAEQSVIYFWRLSHIMKKTKLSVLTKLNVRTIRDAAAVNAAKATALACHLSGKQGSALPGRAARAISPSILADLSARVREKTFAVCGTNGKTTVNNLLCRMLEAEGYRVVCNRAGANMLNGITGAFADAAGISGQLKADYAALEVDEASAQHVFAAVKPDYLILTNLFRDQLDRYGEIDITAELLLKAIRLVPDMKLVINADDPLSVYLAQESGNPFVCYGIGEKAAPTEAGIPDSREVREGRFCKKCGAPLHYEYYHYGQMGRWMCSACSFSRPEPVYEAYGISRQPGPALSGEKDDAASGGMSFRIKESGKEAGTVYMGESLDGLYSVYNLLAVRTALRECGHSCRSFNTVVRGYRPPFGRNEHFYIEGRDILLNLAKNPAGFNQNISAMLSDRAPKRLVIVINDNDQDGTDVSWLWDVEFEKAADESIRSVIVSGLRRLDMQLRLKYEEIRAESADTPEEAVERQIAAGKEKIYVLVNYTALFAVHRYLQRREQAGDSKI